MSTKTQKEVKASIEESSTPVKEVKSLVMYIGPNIPGVVVAHTVFNNGIPSLLEDEIKKVPAIKSLLIETNKIIDAKRDLADKYSALSICYKTVANYVKGD